MLLGMTVCVTIMCVFFFKLLESGDEMLCYRVT